MKKLIFLLASVISAGLFTACDDDNEYLLDNASDITPKIEIASDAALIQTEQNAEIEIQANFSNPSGLASANIVCEALSINDLITIDATTYTLGKKYTIPSNAKKGMYFITITLNSQNKLTISSDIKVMVGMKDEETPKVTMLTDLTQTYPAEFELSAHLTDNIGLAKIELLCETETSLNYTEELSGVNSFDFVHAIKLPYSYPSKQLVLKMRLTDLAGLVTEANYTLNVNVYPNQLFIVGDASDAVWDTQEAIELPKIADGVFAGIVKLKATGGWKFIANNGKDTWDPAWGPGDGSDAMSGTLDGTPGGGNIPAPATEDYYKITADFTAMTYTVEKIKALEKIENLYLIGNMNGWTNPDQTFIVYRDDNDLTNGKYTYTGFFKKEGDGCYFKFCPEEDLGTWDNMYCNGANGVLTYGDKDAFSVPGDGYYTVNINLLQMTWEIIPLTETPAEYTKMGLMGAYNNWQSEQEAFMTQSTYDKHMWTTELELPAGEIKFRAESNWDIAWGGGTAIYGQGSREPDSGNINIPEAGTYFIRFNDITGHYIFIKK